jgi:oligopeptidase B
METSVSNDGSAGTAPLAEPPLAVRRPKVDVYHGDRRVDDYFWLREKANPDVRSYLEAENAYCDATMRPTEALQETLYREMLSHIKETDESVPYRQGGWLYYSRTEEGKQYPIHCRRRASRNEEDGRQKLEAGGASADASSESPEEVVLDLNALAEGEAFMSLGVYEVSDDGNLLAYTTDVTGFREYTLRVKDLRTGQLLPERIEKTRSVAWAEDHRTLFYTVEDHAKRPHRVYRHALGDASEDALVYQEDDEMYRVWVSRSRSRRFLFLGAGSHTTTEVRFLGAAEPSGEWTLVASRQAGHEYYVGDHGDTLWIRTNDAGRNFRLVTAPLAAPGRENWAEILPHREDVMLEGVELFAGHVVLLERAEGLPRLRVRDLASGESGDIVFPEPAYAVSPAENREWETTRFRYNYQSLVTPPSVYDYDMAAGTSALLKETEVPGGFDRTNYASERVYATAPDGTQVPISLVYRRGVARDDTAPLFLIGYGSYGYPYPVTFNASRLCLLDRGVVVAIAHIRGGGEMGKPWHDAGRMLNKKNTFTDFIAAAEFLLDQGYGARDRLAVQGGSAGGLLMGAVTNMRPDLLRVVLNHVPFVDVINTMMDETLPLTVGEYEEWGNPQKPDEYAYMKTYCPYTNLAEGEYPAILVKTSFNDSQVMYWEPAKYVAKLRTLKRDKNPLLFKTNMAGGHGGSSGRYDALKETAFDYAFLLTHLGVAS